MPRKKSEWTPEEVRDISVEVYKRRLDLTSYGGRDTTATERMLKADGDGGEKLRIRAGSYDPLTRIYLEVLKNR